MPRHPTIHDQISRSILETAARVLAERGESASMADIAAAAGVGRATLYRYFASREALMIELLHAGAGELARHIQDAELNAVPTRDAFARLVRAFLTAGAKYAALAHVDKQALPEVEDLEHRIAGPVVELLQRAVDDGTVRADVTVPVLHEIFTGMLERGLHLVTSSRLGIEEATRVVAGMFLDGAAATPQAAVAPIRVTRRA